MAELGFRSFLKPAIQAPIIVTFHAPADPRYDVQASSTSACATRDSSSIRASSPRSRRFASGCIGAIGPDEMRQAVNAVRDTLAEMGIDRTGPA